MNHDLIVSGLTEAPPTYPTSTSELTKQPTEPKNIHASFNTSECGRPSSEFSILAPHPSSYSLFHMVHGYNSNKKVNKFGHHHYWYNGPMENGVRVLQRLQECSYLNLQQWWKLAERYNITHWAAHGGSAMSAYCHRSMNPWDDDIDITVASCDELKVMYAASTPVNEIYPSLDPWRYSGKIPNGKHWIGRLLPECNNEWILLKCDQGHKGPCPWKLKSVGDAWHQLDKNDLGGLDIMCFEDTIKPEKEVDAMKKSGYRTALVDKQPLQVVDFGPTKIQMPADNIVRDYVRHRYSKMNFCDFPLSTNNAKEISPPRAAQVEVALEKFYIPLGMRNWWLSQIDKEKGATLTKLISNLDHVEIDNSIADPSNCTIAPGRAMKVVNWNAERGTHWSQYVELSKTTPALKDADLIILNEMDIGMARSQNVHTTRRLAFALGMNYAWGLEFVELTNGNAEEQKATKGQKNSMGLHGNAILSKCKLYDPIIVRDPLSDEYFTSKALRANAQGTEKRLGGRMAMFVKTGNYFTDDDDEMKDSASSAGGSSNNNYEYIIAGSMHKIHPSMHASVLKNYFQVAAAAESSGSSETLTQQLHQTEHHNQRQLGIIVGGDNDREVCGASGLKNLDNARHFTFRADCSKRKYGGHRGDQFCGNKDLKVIGEDKVILPCVKDPMTNGTVQISDHTIIQIEFKI